MVKSGLEKNVLKFHSGLHRYLLSCQANSALLGRCFCTGQQQLWRPSWNFEITFSRPLFTIIFNPKMVSNLRKNFLCIVWHQKPTVKRETIFLQTEDRLSLCIRQFCFEITWLLGHQTDSTTVFKMFQSKCFVRINFNPLLVLQ